MAASPTARDSNDVCFRPVADIDKPNYLGGMTRYALVRSSIAYFAASADEQLAHDMGPDDAVNELPYPLEDMLCCRELTQSEAAVIRHLDDLILHYCSQPGVKPWHDEVALSDDPDWAKIRQVAASILEQLPDPMRQGSRDFRNGS